MIRMPRTCSAPRQPNAFDQPRRQHQDQVAADADAEIGEAHRLAARLVEPARQQHLVGQRPAAHIAERVEQVEQIEHPERRHVRQADQRDAGHHDARHHQPPRPEAIDDPAGHEPEQRADEELAERVARGDLRARPAELPHHEVVVERQPVERQADDREQRDERRDRDLRLREAALRLRHPCTPAAARSAPACSRW